MDVIGRNYLVNFRCYFVYKYTELTLASVDLWPWASEPPGSGVVVATGIHYAPNKSTNTKSTILYIMFSCTLLTLLFYYIYMLC